MFFYTDQLQDIRSSNRQTLLGKNSVDIFGRKFPVGVVKQWSDINIKEEIGEGNFGKVYHGFLHLNEVQRYLLDLVLTFSHMDSISS